MYFFFNPNIIWIHSRGWKGKTNSFFLDYEKNHGLRTPNEAINQRNLKIWADVADKICFGRT